jgi:hypothetical protein
LRRNLFTTCSATAKKSPARNIRIHEAFSDVALNKHEEKRQGKEWKQQRWNLKYREKAPAVGHTTGSP